jgi:hypothetical protein
VHAACRESHAVASSRDLRLTLIMVDSSKLLAAFLSFGLLSVVTGCGDDPCVDACENAKDLDCPNFSIEGDCGALCDAFGDNVDEDVATCQGEAEDCDAYQACGN